MGRILRLQQGLLIVFLTVCLILLAAGKGNPIVGAFSSSPSQKPLPLNQYTGVVYLDPIQCSGSLLKGGAYILTAAHCISDNGTDIQSEEPIAAIFKLPSGEVRRSVSQSFIHPGWTGYESEIGNDLALLKLAKVAPREAQQYELYRKSDEIDRVFTKVGYGYIGIGAKGQDEGSNSEGMRYAGLNRYEALIEILKDSEVADFSDLVPGSQLLFDFDDGTAQHDALGRHFPQLANRGLGKRESATGSGDSGGPSFIDGKIAGISSWGYSDRGFFKTPIADIDRIEDNGSFGEIFGDTRVSFYANWIDSIARGNGRQIREKNR